jgi:hypothetical protein
MKTPRAIARIPPAALEALESRRLLAATPVGPEFRVNEHTVGLGVVGGARAVDADADGDFVVVWNDSDAVDGALVMARLYDRSGAPRGGAFRANTPTTRSPWVASPSVAMDDRGDFVVVYGGQDYLYNVHARRFDASGAPLGPEFRVNTTEGSATQGVQWTSVAMDADGDFVVVWWVSNPTLGGGEGVRGQRFDAAGRPQGEEFRVDDVGGPPFWTPHVAMDADGDFVVGWWGSGAWARRYSASGAPLGPGFAVGDSAFATVPVMAADGRSAVVWGGDGGPVLARRYDAPGNPQGDLIEVAPQGSSNLMASMNASGEFAVSWGDSDVYTRSFDAQGRPTGDAFRVVQPPHPYQRAATPALDDEGDLVVAWTTQVLDQNNYPVEDVWARRFDLDPSPTVAARRVFYDDSGFDGNTPGANAADDAAVATDKVALPRGQWGGLANVTSYDKGLNGIMVDVARLPAGAALTADDFSFRTGTSQDRSAWRAGPRPSGVTVRRGAGVNGTDRVTLTWPAYDPRSGAADPAAGNAWLEVTVKADANTGLASPDVFCFGNLVGETGNFAERMSVNAVDLTWVRAAQRSAAPVTSACDFNRDGRVNVVDLGIARSNFGRALQVAGPEPLTAAAPPMPGRRATRKPARLDVLH